VERAVSGAKKKVAILGGGVGSMVAAFALTNKRGWDDVYEVTVHQMGWRLGGKGASGRNAAFGQRIEEHGLHVWLGFYDNAFRVIQAAYAERPRKPDDPFVSWTSAFKKHSLVVLEERVGDGWRTWPIQFPENDLVPGDGETRAVPALWQYVKKIVAFVHDHFCASSLALPIHHFAGSHTLEAGIEQVLIVAAHELAKKLSDDPRAHSPVERGVLVRAVQGFVAWLRDRIEPLVDEDDELRRLFVVLELGAVIAKGMLEDGVVDRGLDILDDKDFIEWLRGHGASELTVSSALVRGLYDLVFAYEGGDVTKPNFAAGVALRSALHVVFDYKGAVFWKMQAGMGDTIFTPLYEVLLARGVRFEFFHKITNLGLSADSRRVETIAFDEQAPLAAGLRAYDPLIRVNSLGCWPSAPRWEQIEASVARELQTKGVDLESYYSGWRGKAKTLTFGDDFDLVILGLPPAALARVAPELVAAKPAFGDMVREVKSVATQAMQLWLGPTLEELGWTGDSPIMDAYADPQNTWADMTHLLPREAWDATGPVPRNIAYFCGPLADLPESDDLPARALEAVTNGSTAWADANLGFLWPKAAPATNPAGIDWTKVLSRFFRANVEPSERYVLSVKGSNRYRLAPDASGFGNVYLVGDWTDNGFNAGCVEAAAMSGLLAVRAITGWDIPISWDPTV
jgi:uncharacterized protein with NAD-binding domain and iron-sulfur cluster